jgi:hypothetical protein
MDQFSFEQLAEIFHQLFEKIEGIEKLTVLKKGDIRILS